MCLEDTVSRIMERYLVYNSEISSYIVKYVGLSLNKNLNLSENGVTLKFDDSVEDYVPTLMLYYQERLAPYVDLKPWIMHTQVHVVVTCVTKIKS